MTRPSTRTRTSRKKQSLATPAASSASPADVAPSGDVEAAPGAVAPYDPSVPPVPYPTRDALPCQRVSAAASHASSPLERELFERLYTHDWSFVRRTVERYGVPARDADDVTQEVFTVALRRIADCDAARSARPWLFVIAVQFAANYRKLARHRVEPLTGEASEPASAADDVETALMADEERALVRELIGRLRPKLRAVLVMHDIEERPMAEIAAELDIPLKTAYARLRLAREEARRRGQAVASAALAIHALSRLTQQDLCRVGEVLLAYGRPAHRAAAGAPPRPRRKIATLQRYPTRTTAPRGSGIAPVMPWLPPPGG
jgi:RNA polymerase sigma factor (sigma-70 family)